MIDPLRYYSLESFLFKEVHPRFRRDGCIGARDFFSIVIWKANRAKSKVARRLLAKAGLSDRNLDRITRELTGSLSHLACPKDRLRCLIVDWKFRLPMASAILTVLYPEEFTVYDVRVCDTFKEYRALDSITEFETLWTRFELLIGEVRRIDPTRSLRDNDRTLWGKSALDQLDRDIKGCFGVGDDGS
jgi:hypothetical protein